MKARLTAVLTAAAVFLLVAFGATPANATEVAGPPVAPPQATSATSTRTSTTTLAAHDADLAAIPASVLLAADQLALKANTGQYDYICVGIDGMTYMLPSGEPTQNCHGSYLLKYINGVKVQTISLTTSGAISDPYAINVDCALATAGAAIVVLSVAGNLLWVASAAVGGIGYYRACLA